MDLDNDGHPDILSGSWPGEIFLFRGTEEQIEQIKKEQQKVRKRMMELRSKLPAEYERHGWVWLFLQNLVPFGGLKAH